MPTSRLSQPTRRPSWTTNKATAASSATPPSRRKNTTGAIGDTESRATTAATITSGVPSFKPPLAFLSQRNRSGTLKLSSYANPATSSHARKQAMTASAPPMSAIGDGSSARRLAMRRGASQTAAPTARTATALPADALSNDERQDDDHDHDALRAVDSDPDPRASVPLRRVGEDATLMATPFTRLTPEVAGSSPSLPGRSTPRNGSPRARLLRPRR